MCKGTKATSLVLNYRDCIQVDKIKMTGVIMRNWED